MNQLKVGSNGSTDNDDDDGGEEFKVLVYNNGVSVFEDDYSGNSSMSYIVKKILGDGEDFNSVDFYVQEVMKSRKLKVEHYRLTLFQMLKLFKLKDELVLHIEVPSEAQGSDSSDDDSDIEERRNIENSWDRNSNSTSYMNTQHGMNSGFDSFRNSSMGDSGDDDLSTFQRSTFSNNSRTSYFNSTPSTPKIPVPEGLIGLQNQGATCYLNSLIQALYMTPEFRRMIYLFEKPWESLFRDLNEGKSEAVKDVILHMQLLFARMQTETEAVSTNALTSSFGWENNDSFIQHDVQELNRVLCDNLEEKMKGRIKDGSPTMASLYRGTTVNLIKCTKCKNISSREEDFYDVSLVVKGKKNVYESLNEFTEVEVLENENAYSCEKCQSKQTAHKSMKFKTLPQILNIQLKRFEYDWENDVRVKLNDDIKFPPYLRMENYLVGEEIYNPSTEEDSQKTQPIEENESKSPVIFELYAILVHSGNAGYGHYYAYLKNFTDGNWYKFNDERVDFVSQNNISDNLWLGQTGTGWGMSSYSSFTRSSTPYMLVYRKRDDILEGLEEKKNQSPTMGSPTESYQADWKGTSNSSASSLEENNFWPYLTSQITKEEIPEQILSYLFEQKEEEERKRQEKIDELKHIKIMVMRNNLSLPTLVIKLLKTATMGDLRQKILETVSQSAGDEKWYYRLRRIATRRNKTNRMASDVYDPQKDHMTLIELKYDTKEHPMIYLEQSKEDHTLETEFAPIPDDQVFIHLQLFDREKERPTTICDVVFPKEMTFSELKDWLILHHLPNVQREQINFLEEETIDTINVFKDIDNTFQQAKLLTGDIVHIEITPVGEELDQETTNSVVQKYFQMKRSETEMSFEETDASYQRRMDANNSENKSNHPFSKKKIINEKVIIHQGDSSTKIKGIIQMEVGNEIIPNPHLIKIILKERTWGFDSKLVTINNDNVGFKLKGKSSIHFLIEILEEPDEYRSGDIMVSVTHQSDTSGFLGKHDFKFNANDTFGDLKKVLEEKTKVPVARQMILKLNTNYSSKNYEDIALKDDAQVGTSSNWILHELSDEKLNPIHNDEVRMFQVVQFLGWESGYYPKMKNGTDILLLVFDTNSTLEDIKKGISANYNIPSYWILPFFVHRDRKLPFYKNSIELHPFRFVCNNIDLDKEGEPSQPMEEENPTEQPNKVVVSEAKEDNKNQEEKSKENGEALSQEEQDLQAYNLIKEHIDPKELPNLEAERKITIGKYEEVYGHKFNPLHFIGWSEKRPEKKNRVASRKGQKVVSADSEVLKIKS
eukprot:TRINITY_DN5491_c0_g1_i1.p1 TRINITY_DN5491_c0_g1~~TRINITY_DN5491_c0_g1_i1.p1  ORF type:complete len:1424 (-),score=574.98 TRINITY_DN5491_c0_g1_i1:1578-5423(-)